MKQSVRSDFVGTRSRLNNVETDKTMFTKQNRGLQIASPAINQRDRNDRVLFRQPLHKLHRHSSVNTRTSLILFFIALIILFNIFLRVSCRLQDVVPMRETDLLLYKCDFKFASFAAPFNSLQNFNCCISPCYAFKHFAHITGRTITECSGQSFGAFFNNRA